MVTGSNPARTRGLQRLLSATLFSVVLSLAACGGSDDGAASATGSDTSPGPVARLEVSPTSVLLTAPGQTRALKVRAFDAADTEIANPSLTFTSSRPGEIAVGPDGTVTATVAAGSTLIGVSSAGVQATPVLAAAVALADGVVTVSDEQVVQAPAYVTPSPTADPEAAPQFQVRLSGVGLPAAGTMLVGTGSQPLAGSVVSATAVGDQADILLQVVPLPTLFRQVSLDVDFTAEQTAPWLQLGAAAATPTSGRMRALALPLDAECDGDISRSLLSLDQKLKVTPSVAVGLKYTLDNGTVRTFHVGANGSLDVSGKVSAQLSIAVTGSIKCKALLGAIIIPITGPLSVVLAPIVPVYGKFDLSAQVAANLFSMSGELKNTTALAMALDYDPAEGLRSSYDGSVDSKPKFEVDFNRAGSLRVKGTSFMGLGSGVALGNVLARLDVIEASAGPELEVRFGGVYDVAQDAGYQAGYGAKAKLSIGPGSAVKKAMKLVLGTDLVSVSTGVSSDIPLATSVTPTLVSIDRDSFAVGDDVAFKVQLDSSTTDFPIVGYNVKELRIYRLKHDLPVDATLVATAVAAAGQTAFELHWTADVAGNTVDAASGKPTFYAMYVDNAMSLLTTDFPFELGPVQRQAAPALFRVAGTGTSMMAIGDDGVLRSIGMNNGGALGTNDAVGATITSPGVVLNATGVVSVTGSAWFGAMLLNNGSVWTWGWGPSIGSYAQNNPVPFQTLSSTPGDPIISISSGYKSTAVVSRSGLVYRYGDVGTRGISDTRAGAIAAAEGYSHTAVLTSDGKVYVWGDNTYGQLGSGAHDTPAAASVLVPGLPFIVAIAAGNNFTLALAKDGTVWAWGSNGNGELGLGQASASAPPTQVPSLTGIRKVSAGEAHAMALGTDGSVYGWGQNSSCQLGTGDGGSRASPTLVFSGATDIDGAEFSSVFVSGGVAWRTGLTRGLTQVCTPTATALPATSH